MRPDIGIHTIHTRIAALKQTGQTAGRGSAAPPPAGFAAALDQQMGVGGQMSRAGGTASTAYAPALGPGVRLTGGGLISPQSPGAGAVASAYGTGHADHADHADHVHGAPALDRTGPPPELQAYGNGRIPAGALEPLGVGDHSLWAPAARAYRDLAAAAARDGVTIGVNSSYRDLAGQQRMVEKYGLYSQGGRAAAPGTSNHGWGVSIDLQLDGQAQAWMRDNAARYGFVEDVPREPWHWTFKASGY